MDYYLVLYTTFLWLGLSGLYSLRNMSIQENFKLKGTIIGFAASITIGIVLVLLRLSELPKEKSKFGMFISTILAGVFLFSSVSALFLI